ncbi:MAG: reverse transcriptase family protein, partial [Acidimicrobiia bacterium]
GEADRAAYIGCSQQVVNRLLSDPPGLVFVVHEIPKRGRHGTFRRVLEVQGQDSADAFKALNRRLQSFITGTLPGFPHRSAHGYVPGRSTLSNARVHVGCPMILKLDIRDFFPSITLGQVRMLFLSLGLRDEAADAVARLVTVEGRLALGLHTSPLIANAVCHGLDGRLSQLVEPEGGRYSRYADDLTFSGARLPKRVDLVTELARDGFTIAEEKWRVVRRGRGLFVTGLSLEAGDRPRVPKAFKRRLRQELYYATRYGLVEHVGRRDYCSIESGVNKIHGRIQYLRGIERQLGDKLHEQWTVLLRKCGQEVSCPGCRANAVRTVLFCIDESEIDAAEGPVLAVALVAIEDREVVSAKLREFREQVHAEPFVTTEASVLDAEGLHYNRLSEDVRTRIVTLVAGLPARVFVAYERLATCEKSEYSATYLRLFEFVLEGRLLLYSGCDVEVAIEQNSKITREQLQSVVTRIYRRLVELGSRRPTAEPKAKVVSKQDEESIALPDVFLGVFGAFATAPQSTAQESGEKKKRKFGNQAMLRFEQLRDKFRMIKSVGSGEVFSRRRPFQPWSASRLVVSRGTAPAAYHPRGRLEPH